MRAYEQTLTDRFEEREDTDQRSCASLRYLHWHTEVDPFKTKQFNTE